jgi:hypothetical protein
LLGVRLAGPALLSDASGRGPRYARKEWGQARPRRWPQLPWRAVTAPLLKWLPPHRSHQDGFLYVRNAGVYGPFGLIPGRASRAVRPDARSPIEGRALEQCLVVGDANHRPAVARQGHDLRRGDRERRRFLSGGRARSFYRSCPGPQTNRTAGDSVSTYATHRLLLVPGRSRNTLPTRACSRIPAASHPRAVRSRKVSDALARCLPPCHLGG